MSTLEEVIQSHPGRRAQFERLFNIFAHKSEALVDAVYVYGGPSSGKSSVLTSLLRALDRRHAIVNLIECYTQRILFESILNKLTDHRIRPGDSQAYAKCDNAMEFVANLRKCAAVKDCVIVLDKAERLRDMEANVMPCLLRLRELSGLNVCVVFVTELTFQKFYVKGHAVDLIKIHFEQYTKDEIYNILTLDYNHAETQISNNYTDLKITLEFYQNYLNVFLSVFYRACRDLSELKCMSRVNFIHYCQPVHKKECKLEDSMALWRHIAPILKSSLEVLYLRFNSSAPAQLLELPFYAKYLLIAAYLASYNSAKDDKRLFVKYHGKKRKTLKDVKAKNKVSELLNTQLGPKPFTFDRLLAIFYAILDDKVGFNNNLLVQVSSLVGLQMLTALSDNCNLDGQKYKCNVSFDFIQSISKMVGFNIRKYLSDFSHM